MSAGACIMLVAVEASGDALGRDLARALRRRLGEDVRFVGVGGEGLAAEGVVSPFDVRALSIVGFFDGLWIYPRVLAWADRAAAIAVEHDVDAAVLIDSWGFTIRVAERLRRLRPDLPIIKYVGPQVWAHRPGRAKRLARLADLLLSTQPRDAPEYEGLGLRVVFVGDPALQRDFAGADPTRLRRRLGAGPDDPILVLLPGSRRAEVDRLWPHFRDAADRLAAARPRLRIVIPAARPVADLIRARASGWWRTPSVIEDDEGKMDAMVGGTAAIACSGTVTTELALAGQPFVVAYRLGPVSHAVLRRLYRLDHICLLNIASGERVVPELVQNACTGEALAAAVAPLLDDPDARARQRAAQDAALDLMGRGGGDVSEAAAEEIARLIETRRGRVVAHA